MKKIKALLLATCALLLTACSESSYEYHNTYFYPQQPYGKVLYADQESDSTTIISYDNWTARTTADWFSINPTSANIVAGSSASTRVDITTTPNTGTTNRTGAIEVDAYDKIGMMLYQYRWLNVTNPSPAYKEAADGTIAGRTAEFNGTVSAALTTYELKFRVYKDGATLSCDADWISLPETTFSAGAHTVSLALSPNPGETARTATLTLSSNGISTPITLTQSGQPKE